MFKFYDASECFMPEGEFLNSCRNFELEAYHSTDERVPTLCKFQAECYDQDGNLPIDNVVYLPANIQLTDVANNDGYLTYSYKFLSNAIAKEFPELYSRIMERLTGSKEIPSLHNSNAPLIASPGSKIIKYSFIPNSHQCLPLSGSYILTCNTTISRYLSTDPSLSDTELCEAELNCATITNSKISNTVYFNLADTKTSTLTTIQKLENCDGSLVIDSLDNHCNGQSPDHIRNLAQKSGKTGKFTF